MRKLLAKWWYSLNFRYCKSQVYLKTNEGQILDAVWWSNQANEWQEKWREA